MKKLSLLLLLTAALLLSGSASAGISDLIEKLRNGEDFRVRVTAALELGKTKKTEAREPLIGALDDGNAAVRAAAAAALKVLGDPKAIPALRAHRKDPSPAVRSQIKTSIKALRALKYKKKEKIDYVVEIGKMRDGTGNRSRKLLEELKETSVEKVKALPGVVISDEAKNGHAKLPKVMISGKLSQLKRRRDGKQVVITARIEYIVHSMPSRTIKGKYSGSATARADIKDVRTKKSMSRLRSEVIAAAIQSAMRRAPEAIEAAAKE